MTSSLSFERVEHNDHLEACALAGLYEVSSSLLKPPYHNTGLGKSFDSLNPRDAMSAPRKSRPDKYSSFRRGPKLQQSATPKPGMFDIIDNAMRETLSIKPNCAASKSDPYWPLGAPAMTIIDDGLWTRQDEINLTLLIDKKAACEAKRQDDLIYVLTNYCCLNDEHNEDAVKWIAQRLSEHPRQVIEELKAFV